MNNSRTGMAEFIDLLLKHSPQEGVNLLPIEGVFVFRDSEVHSRIPAVYPPGLGLIAQGRKKLYLKDGAVDLVGGTYVSVFFPMPVESVILEARPDKPFLGVGLFFDPIRIADMLLKIEKVGNIPSPQSDNGKVSGIFTGLISDNVLDAATRLIKTLDNPTEASVLGQPIVDELYFRILTDEHGGALKYHLQQQGWVQQISSAIEYIHQNLEKSISVDKLAELVNMSQTSFHRKFKEVMHLSPIQYVKLVKLNKAQTYITEGTCVSEAGSRVGYKSSAQFSREYKRHFGRTPSEEKRTFS